MAISYDDYLALQKIPFREEVRPFLGRRYELYRLVQEKALPMSWLIAHTALMVETRNTINGFLWRVLDRESGHTVHLVGVVHERIHVPGAESYPSLPRSFNMKAIEEWNLEKAKWLTSIIHPKITQCILESRKVYFEVDVQSQEYGMLQMTRLEKFAKLHPEVVNNKMKQTEDPLVQKVSDRMDRTIGLDSALVSLAGKGKVESLEPLDRHITSIETTIQAVFDHPNNITITPEYRLQDLDGGQWGNFEMFEERYLNYPQPLRADWEERTNQYMIPQIKRSLWQGNQDVFVVGVGHYCGDRGILADLSISDYEITRIPLD